MPSVLKVLNLVVYLCTSLFLFENFTKGNTQDIKYEAQQSSTNGSHSAHFACDDDMDTFSLTRDDVNTSWSLTLERHYTIFWIFLSISCGKYDIHIQYDTHKPQHCSQIVRTCETTTKSEIVTCKLDSYGPVVGNKIIITRLDDGAIQIDEIKPIIFEPWMIPLKSHTGGIEGKKALDADLNTNFVTEERNNAAWYMMLNTSYEIKWILLLIRGGEYEVHISKTLRHLNTSTLCKKLKFDNAATKYHIIVECFKKVEGNSVVIRRINEGPLWLFEVHPIICPANHFGINCAKCRKTCVSCNPISGVCNQCRGSLYGDYCQHQCPLTCTVMKCDQQTGRCHSCREGYTGKYCDFQITTTYNKTEVVTINTDSERNKPRTVVMDVYIDDNNEGDQNQFPILLVTLSAVVVLLLVVVVILFVSRWNNLRSKKDKKCPPPKNLPRSESKNESELEEIPQNEAGYAEEEVIVVEYSNLTSQRVSKEQFIEEFPERKRNGTLQKEFNDLPSGLLESYSNALKISNRSGNRYKEIYPYDYNRVKLIRTEDNKDDDFVNASYIHGFVKERAYIAAQGPFNPKTLEDFWTVIWQNDSTRIVMLTSLYEGDKMKCLKYWPDTDLDIGPYTIRLDTVDVYDNYILRYLIVYCQEEEKRVTQFHFTTWPDNSVPEELTSLICFRNLVKNGMMSSDGPIVVHCSAGIGRTGTFIALDYLLEEGAAEQTIDVKGYIAALRHQRGKSIQTCEQYIFLHDSLIEGFTNNSARRSVLSVL
ncbi:receptor-type tyrosine-protein phosphatase alpha-like [Saccostrea cucullata]|uniref:receptor-type tyrosine-protein phosphatase alpha-like n=1 Tax=Saccostrea cuccullata TaxID=36930 RepID=UPI002ED0DF40